MSRRCLTMSLSRPVPLPLSLPCALPRSPRPSGARARGLCATGLLVTALALSACGPAAPERPSATAPLSDAAGRVPSASSTARAASPLAELGRALFFDTRLSDPPGQSCASCHDPRWAFATPREQMQAGITPGAQRDRFGMRNAPTLMYAAFSPEPHYDAARATLVGGLLLDQRAPTLEAQALHPLFNPAEMGNASPQALVARLRAAPYAARIVPLFGARALTDPAQAMHAVSTALAAYQREPEFAPFSSKFDAVRAGMARFNDGEQRGYDVFRDPQRGGCVACHTIDDRGGRPPLFTDFSSHNLGLPANTASPFYRMPPPINPAGERFVDLGVARDPQRAGMEGRFRVPTLRNVAVTSPYMHNGGFASLGEVVRFYATACLPGNPERWAPAEVPGRRDCAQIARPNLTGRDIADLVSFMYALTDGWYDPATGAPGPMQVPPQPPIIGGMRQAGLPGATASP
jgi:cytochrome c peroxidase